MSIFNVPRPLLKECGFSFIALFFEGPFSSSLPKDWLRFLNKIEDEVRGGRSPTLKGLFVSLYDYTIDVRPLLDIRMFRLCLMNGMMIITLL